MDDMGEWIRLRAAWGLRPLTIFFDLTAEGSQGDFGFQDGLNGGSELVGVSDNLCLHRGGVGFLDFREFHDVLSLPSGTVVKSGCEARQIKRTTRRRLEAKVSFGGVDCTRGNVLLAEAGEVLH